MFHFMNRSVAKHFNNESEVLKILAAYPHSHIVASLVSWASDDKRYIPSPLAKGNLRSLFSQPPPAFDAAGILWLLRQLVGLASAVGHMHHIRGARPSMTVVHHDIKPENILMFEDVEDLTMPKLMLTDFGSGKVHQDLPDNLSHKTDTYRGTLTYAAPDMHMYGHASRPFDMWALGCVFLEILIWMCLPGAAQAVEEHAQMRCDDAHSVKGGTAMEDMYWYTSWQDSKPMYVLKPSVKHAFRSVENHCRDMDVFQSVLRLVKRLLVVDAPARLKADGVANILRLVQEKTKMELERDPELYLRLASESRWSGTDGNSEDEKAERIPSPPSSPASSF